jgi:hypothetical protein
MKYILIAVLLIAVVTACTKAPEIKEQTVESPQNKEVPSDFNLPDINSTETNATDIDTNANAIDNQLSNW